MRREERSRRDSRDDRDDDRGGRDRDRGGRGERRRGPKGGGGPRRGYRNQDAVRKRAEQTGGDFDSIFKSGVTVWTPKVGENCVRLLPASWEDAGHYGYDVWVHAYIGSSGSNYICPAKTFNKPCAACDEAKELKAAGESEESKEIMAKRITFFYLIDRDDRKPEPKVWLASWNQDKEISEQAYIKKSNTTLYLDDENAGWDLIIKRTGKAKNTRYSYVVDREQTPIDDDPDVQDEILQFIEENPIPDLLRYADNETIAKALDGGTRERDKDLDDDDRGRGRGSVRGRGRDRDEDDEDSGRGRSRGRGRDDDGDEEDTRSSRGDRLRGRGRDEEEDDRPSRRGRSSREDDDGQEDEERGTRGSRSRARDEEDEGESRRPRRGRAEAEDDEEEDERPSRSRRGRGRDEEDERPRTRR
jgi:hypothetical protein